MGETTDEGLSLELSRRFDATPEQVFDAWTGPRWGEWLPPRGARCEVTRIEPHAGGHFAVVMTMPDGRTIEVAGVYREVERPERLVLTWTGNYNNQETLLTLTFQPDGSGTQMNLRQTGFQDAELRDGYGVGWSGEGGSFDKLAATLARAGSPGER